MDARSRRAAKLPRVAVSLAVTLAVFIADYRTGAELSLSLAYLVPIAYVGWVVGRADAIAVALVSAAGWLGAYFLSARFYSRPEILYWNVAMETGIYLTVAWTVSGIRRGMDRERVLRERLERAYQRLDDEDRKVGDIQRGLLPAAPPRLEGYEFAIHYATSTRAGGDYYDFLSLPSGRLGLLVADASGHGSSAAVLMAITRVLVHDERAPIDSPEALLAGLNHALLANIQPGQFVTAVFMALDPATGELELARAGHEPPLRVSESGEIVALAEGGGPPLGAFPGASFPPARARLAPGDTLIAYTDGLTEAMDAEGALFGAERLERVLAAAATLPAESLRDRILDAVREHAGTAPLQDDLSFVVLRARGAPVTSMPPRPGRPAVVAEAVPRA